MRWAAFAVAAALCVPAMAFAAGFDDPGSSDSSQQLEAAPAPAPYGPNVQRQDTPNDPDYDTAEPDSQLPPPRSSNIFDERFDLFGFASQNTRTSAKYLDPAHTVTTADGDGKLLKAQVSGFNAAGAWKITRGDPDVTVAILDTGINWDSAGLRDKVALNKAELPLPRKADGSDCAEYDCNNNGALDVDDYKDDPAVKARADQRPAGQREPRGEDLIKAFSNHTDADGNGYVDDIAGWDFFDDDNNPADTSSYFAAENHGTGRTNEAVEKGNDGKGSIGVCPKCQFMPMRVWDTFVSDQNNFFMAVVYATDNGVEVIEGADGGLYHSSFAEKASQYAYEHGVSQVYSGDDLNTGNHNYPANYNHTMLIQGTVADAKGLGVDLPSQSGDPGVRNTLLGLIKTAGLGTSIPVGTYFRGANTTQFGGHSSISMEGATGSTNTGKAAGAVALVISAAKEQGIDLNADEARELMEQTAEDVLPGDTIGTGNPDPAQAGFDTHFGYGRANVGAAVQAAHDKQIPPEASIASPDWYAPLTGASARITGRAARPRGSDHGFHWKLQYGPGLAPTNSQWTTVREADADSPVTDFGTIDLNAVRASLPAGPSADAADPAGPTLDPSRTDPYKGQFTVRLVVDDRDAATKDGVDRKVLTALDDPTLRAGFPKRLGTGGEAPLRYSDIDGDNRQELVLPTQDGQVHAYKPDGSELPGWPVKTETQFSARAHKGSPALGALAAPLEPPRAPTIADLTGDGVPEVITTAGERLYAWDSAGKLLPGWPIHPDPGRDNCDVAEQKKGIKHPKCGFLASIAIGHLEGRDKPPDVVVPGLDGRLRAYRPDGSAVPGFPVRLIDTSESEPMTAESINSAAIGDLDGDGRDDIVAATNEVYGGSGGGGDVGFGGLLATAGSTSRVYAVKSGGRASVGGPFFPGWPVKPGGIIQDVLPLIGPGHDPALVKVGGAQKVLVSVTGSTSLSLYDVDGGAPQEIQQNASGSAGALNLFESSAVGDIDGSGPGGVDAVKYQVDLEQAANLLLVGQNFPYSHRIGAYDLASGATAPGFPVITDDYQFLSSSTVAKVAPGTSNQILAGTGLGLLHAYDGATGRDVSGFPKVTGGWLFAPGAVSDDKRLAAVTREGYLFEWEAPGADACQPEWPSFRHDQQGTGNYDADGTPPGAPEALSLEPLGGDRYRLKFRSPGDDGFCGTADRYRADVDGAALDLGAPVKGASAFTKDIALPAGARRVTIRAVDGAANAGAPGALERQAPGAGSGGLPGGGATGGGFTQVAPSGGSGSGTRKRKPRLVLKLNYRRGRTGGRRPRRCGRGNVRVSVIGADAKLIKRARLRVGKKVRKDARRPISKRFRTRALRRSHVRRAKASLRLRDGRLVRLSKRFRVCARRR